MCRNRHFRGGDQAILFQPPHKKTFDTPEEADKDPSVNFVRGKVVGFKFMLDAMRAGIAANSTEIDMSIFAESGEEA